MTANELVQKVDLQPVSHSALKLISLIDRVDINNDEIVQVLKYDEVLTAKLLRACNSTFFGLEEAVSSVDQAVFILGHQQILHIVLTLAFSSTMKASSSACRVKANDLWQHSLVSATASDVVLNEIPELIQEKNIAFTACLLHDIGKLALGQTLDSTLLDEIQDRIERRNISTTNAEREVLGTDHGEIGAALLRQWRLPENIIEAVANHHHPVIEPGPRLSCVTYIANCLAHLVYPFSTAIECDWQVKEIVAARFGIDQSRIESMTAAVRESSEQVDDFMAIA